jgi:hypothetical protein
MNLMTKEGLMTELMNSEEKSQPVEREKKGLSRRRLLTMAGVGVLASPFLGGIARADNSVPNTLKGMSKQFADIDLSDEEAAGLSLPLDAMTKGIRSIPVSEDVEPATIFYRRKEG